jgi:hypothetical protein
MPILLMEVFTKYNDFSADSTGDQSLQTMKGYEYYIAYGLYWLVLDIAYCRFKLSIFPTPIVGNSYNALRKKTITY